MRPLSLIFIFMAILLIPHGMGVRFSIGHIDIPRLVILLTTFYGFYLYLLSWIKAKKIILPEGAKLLAGFSSILILSAIFSSNLTASLTLCLQLLTIWVFFPLAIVKIFENEGIEILYKAFGIIIVILSLYAFYELVVQDYLVPPEIRTSFHENEQFNKTKHIRNGVLLSRGPFMWNHALSGIGIILCGVGLYAYEKKKSIGIVITFLTLLIVFSSGVRAGNIGLFIGILAYSIYTRQFWILIHYFASLALVSLLYFLPFGTPAPFVFSADLSYEWMASAAQSNQIIIEKFEALGIPLFFELKNTGTIGIKIAGFILNLLQLDQWWAVGYSFGSFQRPDTILSDAIQYNDPGLLQLFFLESGLFAGGLLLFFLFKAIYDGFKYDQTRPMAVGILAWSIFALSSWEIWPLMLATIFGLLIFRHHATQKITEGKPHNQH